MYCILSFIYYPLQAILLLFCLFTGGTVIPIFGSRDFLSPHHSLLSFINFLHRIFLLHRVLSPSNFSTSSTSYIELISQFLSYSPIPIYINNRREEVYLIKFFDEEYIDYRKKVGTWIPFIQ